ncbi:MAG: FAD:protein FMN transferase [Pseudomonadales bacterium]
MLRRQELIPHLSQLAQNFALGLVILLSLLVSGCHPAESISVLSGNTMGTTYRVSITQAPHAIDPEVLRKKIEIKLLKINKLMSTYDSDSEISRFNRATVNHPFPVSKQTFEVLQFSLFLSRSTRGAFDPTVGPLVDLWGFGPLGSIQEVPEASAIAAAKRKIGYGSLVLTSEPATLTARQPRRLDLSAVAKGFAVDQIGALLDQNGHQSYLVEIGGELLSKGSKPGGVPWRVAVELPEPQLRGILRTVPLIDKAIATSGDYRNYFEHDGKRFSHTLDPRTGNPVTHNLTSVTVLADTAMEADGWATALAVLGPDEGLKLSNQLDIATLMLVRREDALRAIESQAFKEYVSSVSDQAMP